MRNEGCLDLETRLQPIKLIGFIDGKPCVKQNVTYKDAQWITDDAVVGGIEQQDGGADVQDAGYTVGNVADDVVAQAVKLDVDGAIAFQIKGDDHGEHDWTFYQQDFAVNEFEQGVSQQYEAEAAQYVKQQGIADALFGHAEEQCALVFGV